MRWLGPVVDRDDDFAPFLTAHLPVRVTVLRPLGWILVLAGFGVALGEVLHHRKQVQLVGVTLVEVLLCLVLIDLPTRRLHRHSRVGVGYATLHLLSTLAIIAWTWLLPLSDPGPHGVRGAPVFAGLLGDPHPSSPGSYRALAWTCGALAVAGGVVLHLRIQLLGRRWAAAPDPGA